MCNQRFAPCSKRSVFMKASLDHSALHLVRCGDFSRRNTGQWIHCF